MPSGSFFGGLLQGRDDTGQEQDSKKHRFQQPDTRIEGDIKFLPRVANAPELIVRRIY